MPQCRVNFYRACRFTLVALLLSNLTAQAQAEYSAVSKTESLQFNGITDLSEQQVGKIVFKQISQQLELPVEVELIPAKRAEREVNLGDAAGEIMRIYAYGVDNSNVIRVPTPYYSLKTTAFALKDNPHAQRLVNNINQANIGVVHGGKHTSHYVHSAKSVIQVSSTEQMMKLVRYKRVDLALTSYLDGLQFLKHNSIHGIVPLKSDVASHNLYIYLNHQHADLVPLFDDKIKQLKRTGQLAKMIRDAEAQVLAMQ
ncbi:transporter substrate-binding domain-containing protein [Shewanella sp. WXL01]|uniref:transporter substrate-binding domain-containing protein n=1 Tax=Shewanella sp. WXL01 TaxID=2709721 RepID=UPI0014383B33|nr:transporter substrate-binding domain-containing protein [Shewanella sp. WXL01]NKF49060.1 transporter substrate-binding domain-containing protein [Shewanella sp. WXL01]